MPNLFVNLPLPVANGLGASVNTSTMGRDKTIVVSGTFPGATITIEASVDGGVEFAPIAVFQSGSNKKIVPVAAEFLRVRVAGRSTIHPFAANIAVAATLNVNVSHSGGVETPLTAWAGSQNFDGPIGIHRIPTDATVAVNFAVQPGRLQAVDTTPGVITGTMPLAAAHPNEVAVIKIVAGAVNACNITRSGAGAVTSAILAPLGFGTYVSDGVSNWMRISG
jgi:hypothetical protein